MPIACHRRKQWSNNTEMEAEVEIDSLTREALKRCAEQNVDVSRALMKYLVQSMYTARIMDLIEAENDNDKLGEIYEWIFARVMERSPDMQMLRLSHYFRGAFSQFDQVQAKYEKITKDKLQTLLEAICSINSKTKKDQDDLFKKIVIYLVAANKLFSIKNAQMMHEAKCALQSVLSPEDLLDFVSRKKHYRLSFLDRMGKIMAGILLYNKQAGMGGEGIRDVLNDITLGYKNTLQSLEIQLSNCSKNVALGLAAVPHSVTLNLKTFKQVYRIPADITVDELKYFNKFNYLYMQYEFFLRKLLDSIQKLNDFIAQNSKEMKETFYNLNEVIKFRLAIPTELVFPHFIGLFEAWYKILMQLYYLVEINRINDDMVGIVASNYRFEAMAAKLAAHRKLKTVEVPIDIDTRETPLMPLTVVGTVRPCFITKFCGLTIALTGGILNQSEPSLGLLPVQDHFIAFRQKGYARFAQTHYTTICNILIKTARENPEISVLFKIAVPFIVKGEGVTTTHLRLADKVASVANQTEHCVPPSTIEERNTYSWNCWDYRRRAIQLANLRKSLTHSSQTCITYSSRDVTVQTYDIRSSTHRGICSSSQWSKSVCRIPGEREKVQLSDCPTGECPPIVEEDDVET